MTRSSAAHRASGRRRVEVIDIARGFAMLLVCVSHFARVYLPASAGATATALSTIGMIASPSFVLLSGMLVGIEYATRGEQFSRFRLKLADRALFLFTVGHVLMLLSTFPHDGDSPAFFCSVFITDAIAFSLLIAPWLITRLTGRERVVVGVFIVSICWLIVDDWQPRGAMEIAVKGIFFGDVNRSWFPLVPWLGVYLASTTLGEYVAGMLKRREYSSIAWKVLSVGAALVAGSLVLRGVRWAAAHQLLGPFRDTRGLQELTSIWQKYPPGPVYVLFFAGIGLCLIAGLVALWRMSIAPSALRTLGAVGQSSLFTYVLQTQIYFVLLYYAHLPYVRAWFLAFALTLAPLALAAQWWSKRGMNRYLTVGLPTIVAAIAARRHHLLRTGG